MESDVVTDLKSSAKLFKYLAFLMPVVFIIISIIICKDIMVNDIDNTSIYTLIILTTLVITILVSINMYKQYLSLIWKAEILEQTKQINKKLEMSDK